MPGPLLAPRSSVRAAFLLDAGVFIAPALADGVTYARFVSPRAYAASYTDFTLRPSRRARSRGDTRP